MISIRKNNIMDEIVTRSNLFDLLFSIYSKKKPNIKNWRLKKYITAPGRVKKGSVLSVNFLAVPKKFHTARYRAIEPNRIIIGILKL
jgi:hypothetical protein